MKQKILVVDDNPHIINIIIDILSENNADYYFYPAKNGKIAYDLALLKKPDLIITDWDMPIVNGIELIKNLKANKQTQEIPIIMATAVMLTSSDLKESLEAGAVDYIRKPVDEIELIARVQATLKLSESYKTIKEINEVKDNILAVISHDLRGPVGTIKSFIELVLDESANFDHEKKKKFLQQINNQSSSILNILENLLSWANSQRDNIIFNPKKQQIGHALHSNIKLLEETANYKKILIINKISDNVLAYYDLNLISVVLRNLIANALKFTPEGGNISIDANTYENSIEILVTDTGVGIDPERINNIFSETHHEATYDTNAQKGSGLGLKLCKKFVEKHNGKIWVKSTLNKGSSFIFTLPLN